MHLKAIIFDWAGTAVDFGSLCPVAAMSAAFADHGIEVSAWDIQQFMGLAKREHVRRVLELPEITAKWQAAHQRRPAEADVDAVHINAEKRMLETVADSAMPTPHLLEAVAAVRARGLRIGSTTGYTTPLMERLVPAAALHGFSPELWVASDQVPQGRPWPWMIFRNLERLQICPPAAVAKLGDTVVDIEEAQNAGLWSIGVVESSSLAGKSRAELEAMNRRERAALVQQVRRRLAEAGAHWVIDNLSELPQVLDEVDSRIRKGLLPRNRAATERSGGVRLTPADPVAVPAGAS